MKKNDVSFVGVETAPYFKILKLAGQKIKNLNFFSTDEFINNLLDKNFNIECVFLLGCDFNSFTIFFNNLKKNNVCLNNYKKILKKSLILCDSIKLFWRQFCFENKNLFDEFRSIDMPFKNFFLFNGAKMGSPIYGMPIYELVRNIKINLNEMNMITFAGQTSIYPERLAALKEFQNQGIPIVIIDNAKERYPQRIESIPYDKFLKFLMHSFFTVNFPLTPKQIFHVKGRYWEAWATGNILAEIKNPVLKHLMFKLPIINYDNPSDLKKILSKIAKDEIISNKNKLIESSEKICAAKNYFNQYFY